VHAQGPAAGSPPQEERSADGGSNEIVVTARRVEERLQDVPIAVSALSSDDLSRQALDDLGDIAEKTVGFAFEALTPLIVQPTIRGQTNLRVDSPVQNVAFYLDGVYLQRGYLVDQSLLELERVEVIKGPQSALYGRNAFAGAVNLVSRRPDLDDPTARVGATLGTNERFDLRGAVGLPVVPGRLAAFLSVAHSQFDGTWDNRHPLADADGVITEGNVGGWNKESYQARVVWRPVDAIELDALYIRTERFLESVPTYTIGTAGTLAPFTTVNASPRPDLLPPFTVRNRLYVGELPAAPIVSPQDTTRPPGIVIDPRSFGLRGPTELMSGKVTWSPDGPVGASYQYGRTEARVEGRGSVSPNPLLPAIVGPLNLGALFDSSGSGSSFEGDSHEVKLTYDGQAGLRALIGVNLAETVDINSNLAEGAPVNSTQMPDGSAAFPVGPGRPFPNGLLQRFTYLVRDEKIWSLFGFFGWEIGERFELALEGRYTEEDQTAIDLLTRDPSNPSIQALIPPRFERTENYFTPRATLTFKPSTDSNLYLSVAKGVKAGGLNGNTPFVGQRSYESEKNWTYEIGSKNGFADGQLTLNVAAFYTDWTDLQTSVVRLTAAGAAPGFAFSVPSTVGNVGGVDVYGLEVEGVWRRSDPLSLSFGGAYNRSRYKDGSVSQRFGASDNCDGAVCSSVPGSPTAVLPIGGNRLERVPEFDGYVAVDFDTELANGWGYFARVDVTHQSKFYVDEANLAFVPDRTLANASTGLTVGRFTVQAWVKNLFDKKYVSNSFFLIGTGGARSVSYTPVLGERRTLGFTTSVAF